MRDEHKNPEEDFTLETILAEYKSDAFIAGQQKTPAPDLEQETQRILEETLGELRMERKTPTEALPSAPITAEIEVEVEQKPQIVVPKAHVEEVVELTAEPVQETVLAEDIALPEATEEIDTTATEEPVDTEKTQVIPEDVSKSGSRLRPRERQRHIEPGEVIEIPLAGEALLKAYAEQSETEAENLDEQQGFFGKLLNRFTGKSDTSEDWNSESGTVEEEGEYDPEDLLEDETTLQRAAGKYGRDVGAHQMRGMGACLISLLLLLFTSLGDAGRNLPGMMGTVQGLTLLLLFGLVLVMLITSEVIATGMLDFIRLRPGAESLVTLAAFAVILDNIHILSAGIGERALPYNAVVGFALGVYLLGFKSVRNAMKLSLRTAAMGRDPYVVSSSLGATKKGFSLVKTKSATEGFVRKTQQMDFSEYIYQFKAPIAILCAALFSVLAAAIYAGQVTAAIHYFSAMMVVSAGFTGLLIYGLPFGSLARKLSKVGASLAGWGGATEVSDAKGLIITDSDVFPRGTLSISGVRVFEKPKENQIIAYTCAVVIASGCGLSGTFADVLERQKLPTYQAEDLFCYEGGGIGAKVEGEEVVVGCVNLMNLLGIRLPQNLNVKNAVFVAMGGELAAVFAIDYVPLNSVKEALVSLMHLKARPLFALRDFNISPMMLKRKFMIDTEKMEFLTYAERYHLSALTPEEKARPFAILAREGLAPLVGVALGGKRLKNAVVWGTILSVASSAIGFVLLASFFLTDAARTANTSNLFLYLLAWMAVLCVMAKTVKID